jgi:hypothetical protein
MNEYAGSSKGLRGDLRSQEGLESRSLPELWYFRALTGA